MKLKNIIKLEEQADERDDEVKKYNIARMKHYQHEHFEEAVKYAFNQGTLYWDNEHITSDLTNDFFKKVTKRVIQLSIEDPIEMGSISLKQPSSIGSEAWRAGIGNRLGNIRDMFLCCPIKEAELQAVYFFADAEFPRLVLGYDIWLDYDDALTDVVDSIIDRIQNSVDPDGSYDSDLLDDEANDLAQQGEDQIQKRNLAFLCLHAEASIDSDRLLEVYFTHTSVGGYHKVPINGPQYVKLA